MPMLPPPPPTVATMTLTPTEGVVFVAGMIAIGVVGAAWVAIILIMDGREERRHARRTAELLDGLRRQSRETTGGGRRSSAARPPRPRHDPIPGNETTEDVPEGQGGA